MTLKNKLTNLQVTCQLKGHVFVARSLVTTPPDCTRRQQTRCAH